MYSVRGWINAFQEIRILKPLRQIDCIDHPAFCCKQAKAAIYVGIHLYRLEKILFGIGIIMNITFNEVEIMHIPFYHMDIDFGDGVVVQKAKVLTDS